jgi:hypothetical protein
MKMVVMLRRKTAIVVPALRVIAHIRRDMPGRKKKTLISSGTIVFFTVLPGDVRPLSYFEQKIAYESGIDPIGVSNSEVIRTAIHRAYEVEKRNRGNK